MGSLMGGHISCYGLLFLLIRKKKTIFIGYLIVIAKYGHPIRVQLDCVVEHSFVPENMEHAKLNVYKPYLTSSSVHN
jgi:hypothetical protein